MRPAPILLVAMAACLAVTPAVRADSPVPFQEGLCGQIWPDQPVLPDDPRIHTLTIDGQPINVAVPPGYDDPGNETRYPVLYLTPGGGWGTTQGPATYLAFTDILQLSATAEVIVVNTYGGNLAGYLDWEDGSQQWETFNIERVIPTVDAAFRTLPDRAHRAIAGESTGGFGASFLASRHPDRFAAVGVFSPGAWVIPVGMALLGGYNQACHGGSGAGAFGPRADELDIRRHSPLDLARNLSATSVYLAAANDVPCDIGQAARAASVYPTFEVIAFEQAHEYHRALTNAGVEHTAEFFSCGVHDWPLFETELHHFWPQMLVSFGSPDPASFDYRSADPAFSVWDWTFRTDPARAPEFLDVTDASASGLTLTGSGVTTVTTAPTFGASQEVRLSNGQVVLADESGRITFTIDLGVPHQHQQYTALARAAEALAAGRYWTTGTISWEVRS